jgi:Ca2+-binding RTX toxin-like protein
MATFYANVKVNITGKGHVPPGQVSIASGNLIQIEYNSYYENITGSFSYKPNKDFPIGFVTGDYAYDYYGNTLTSWTAAPGAQYDAKTMYKYLQNDNLDALYDYAFYLDDEIYGSAYNDKLDGHNGNDYINGWRGNDKLWGGPGYDGFYFQAYDGRDVIKDFSRKQDTIILDSSLAWDMSDVAQAAQKYKKGVVLNFGGDAQIKIEGLTMKQLLNKTDFDFV